MEKEKERKGFWATLFAPKKCSCTCGGSIIEEVNAEDEPLVGRSDGTGKDKDSSCSCRR